MSWDDRTNVTNDIHPPDHDEIERVFTRVRVDARLTSVLFGAAPTQTPLRVVGAAKSG